MDGNEPIPPHLAALRAPITIENFNNKVESIPSINYSFASLSSPLHLAAAIGNLNMVRLLVKELGANIEIRDFSGLTPLSVAVGEGTFEMVEELIKLGAKVNTKGYHGDTPLHGATVVARKDVVSFLLGKGADPNGKDNNGLSPLDIAKMGGEAEIMEMLFLAGTVSVPLKIIKQNQK